MIIRQYIKLNKTIRTILFTIIVILIINFGIYFFVSKNYSISDEWKSIVKKNYDEFISEVDNKNNRIPMIISTDQHGCISVDSEVYSYINDLVDWNKISKIINLGDTVNIVLNPLELHNYKEATKCLPENKRIEVIGNHDRYFVIDDKYIEKSYFPNHGAMYSDDEKAFVIEDNEFNVKYLVVDTKYFPYFYEDGRLSAKQANFIIDVLSKNDESDIVLLSHAYLFNDEIISRDGSTFTGSEFFIGSRNKDIEIKQSFIDMLAARKNKTSGILIDSEGFMHSYDFSNCKSNFLITLHGHHHSEGYETKDGITEFLFQSMIFDNKDNLEPLCFYFAYIDKSSKTLKVWKNIAGYEPLEIKF